VEGVAPGSASLVFSSLYACVLGLILISLPAQAAAQTRHEPPPEALQFFRSGQDHYAHGRYHEAAVDLERALALDPGSPTLLYNLGRVYELLGDTDAAAGYYRSYLRMLPDGSEQERAEVEATITRLEGAAAHGEVAPPPHPGQGDGGQLRPAYVQVRGVVDLPFWVTLGSGGGLLLGGGLLGVFALSAHGDATDIVLRTPDDAARRQNRLDQSQRRALSADILMGTGAAALIAAGLLYLLRERTVEVLPGATADGRGVSLNLRLTL